METNNIEYLIAQFDGHTNMLITELRDARRVGVIDDDTYDDIRHRLKTYMKYLSRKLRKSNENKELNDFVTGKTKKLSKNKKIKNLEIKFNKGALE